MITRILIATILVLVVVALFADRGSGQQTVRPFEATAVPRRIETQLPPPGRAGNRDLLQWTIRDRHGRAFGVANLDCDWYHDGHRVCVGMFRLARGTFAVMGSGHGRDFGELVVLGGTGDYATPQAPLTYNATRAGKLILKGAF